MKKQFKKVCRTLRKRAMLFSFKAYKEVSRPLSSWARRTFEFRHIQRAFGILVISSVFSTAVLPSSVSGLQTYVQTNYSQAKVLSVETKTQPSIRLPVEVFTISQGYHLFHPGIDLAAAKGTPVFPVMEGKVEEIGYGRFAFGNYAVINHGSGIRSLYAHLSKVEVAEGETVDIDSVLGLIGSTGWSTGPHLHLQIEQNGKWINPKTFFEGYFGKRLASTR